MRINSRSPMEEFRRSILLYLAIGAALMVALSGCVFRKTAFNHAEKMLTFEIDAAFDVNNEQERFLDREVGKFLRGMHDEEIPLLQKLFSDMGERTEKGIARKDVEEFYARWDDIFLRVAKRASVPTGEFLSTVTTSQVEHLQNYQDKNNKKRGEDGEKGEEAFLPARCEHVSKRISVWIGSLNEAQSSAVADYAKASYTRVRREREAVPKSQARLRAAVLAKPGAKRLQELFLQQQTSPFSGLDEEHAAVKREEREAWVKLYAAVAAALTEKQAKKFRQEMNDLAVDVDLIGAR